MNIVDRRFFAVEGQILDVRPAPVNGKPSSLSLQTPEGSQMVEARSL